MNAKNTELMNKIRDKLESKGYECSKEKMLEYILEEYLKIIK